MSLRKHLDYQEMEYYYACQCCLPRIPFGLIVHAFLFILIVYAFHGSTFLQLDVCYNNSLRGTRVHCYSRSQWE